MLITEDYRKEQEMLHQNPNYGVASVQFAPIVTDLVNKFGVAQLLDYGCGKGRLGYNLKPERRLEVYGYDPAIPDLSDTPEPCEMVACIDVLEHIEPNLLDNVLDDLCRVTLDIGFFTIHTGPAVKTLSDGRNAHLIQKPYSWWLPKIWSRFDIQGFQQTQNGFFVVVRKDGSKRLRQSKVGDRGLVTA